MNLDGILLDCWEYVLDIFNFWRNFSIGIGGVKINAFILILTFGVMETLIPLLLRERESDD